MSGPFWIAIALVVSALSLGVAWVVLHFTPLKPPFDFGAVDALVGIVYGILLAILVLFASGHYTSAIDDSNREATALNNMYKAAGPLEPGLRDQLRHEIVCYAREKIELEWPKLRESNGDGSAAVFARTREMGGIIEKLARTNPQNLTVETLFQANLDRGAARQLMIDDSRPQLPVALWFVVMLGIGIVVFLLSIRYFEQTTHLFAAVIASLLLLLGMVGAIAELDRPFASLIGLQPRAMESVLTSVVQSSAQSATALRPCTPVP